MVFKYKTIMYVGNGAKDNGKTYSLIPMNDDEYCCEDMRRTEKTGYAFDMRNSEPVVVMEIVDRAVRFCPFCGESVATQEYSRMVRRAITKEVTRSVCYYEDTEELVNL